MLDNNEKGITMNFIKLVLIVVMISLSLSLLSVITSASLQDKLEIEPISGSPILKYQANTSKIIQEISIMNIQLKDPAPPPDVIKDLYIFNFETKDYYTINVTKRYDEAGGNCYIFVNDDEWQTDITQLDVDTLAAEFENIYKLETIDDTFGIPPDAPKDSDRIIIVLTDCFICRILLSGAMEGIKIMFFNPDFAE